MACANCHGTLPASGNVDHADGVVAASWSALVSSTSITVKPAGVRRGVGDEHDAELHELLPLERGAGGRDEVDEAAGVDGRDGG